MAVCCCGLAGTTACQHCSQNPFATDVWTNKTVTVDHIEAKPFGDGHDVCPVCGKPSTTGKSLTNADRIRAKSDEELAAWISEVMDGGYGKCAPGHYDCTGKDSCAPCWLEWLKSGAEG